MVVKFQILMEMPIRLNNDRGGIEIRPPVIDDVSRYRAWKLNTHDGGQFQTKSVS
jgi:hypothetical protein